MRRYAGIGSRETPQDVLDRMTEIAIFLRDKGFVLRSGGAAGADSAFEAGSGHSKEIFLPWEGYNHKTGTVPPDTPEAKRLVTEFHPASERLSSGAMRLMMRNGNILLGADLDEPVDFVVCWTKDGRASGGTGQAMRIAKNVGIPIFNLFHEDAERHVRARASAALF